MNKIISVIFIITKNYYKVNMEKDKDGKTAVFIPTDLAEKIQKKCEASNFESISSYVVHILNLEMSKEEAKVDKYTYSEDKEKKVKDRLKSLGYLDP